MDNFTNDFIYIGWFENDDKDILAYGHLKGQRGNYPFKCNIIKTDKKTVDQLVPGEIYEVKVIGFNGSYATYGF